jgi:two-component system, chemotaxis family, CheB/CheR fusion protein
MKQPHMLPAIALTGFASASDAARALAAGFQAHMAKPFEMDELRRLIARVAAQRRSDGHAPA